MGFISRLLHTRQEFVLLENVRQLADRLRSAERFLTFRRCLPVRPAGLPACPAGLLSSK